MCTPLIRKFFLVIKCRICLFRNRIIFDIYLHIWPIFVPTSGWYMMVPYVLAIFERQNNFLRIYLMEKQIRGLKQLTKTVCIILYLSLRDGFRTIDLNEQIREKFRPRISSDFS